MMRIFIALLLLIFAVTNAQQVDNTQQSTPNVTIKDSIDTLPFAKKYFCILSATKSYKEALVIANKAVANMHFTKNLRGLTPHKETGLTFSKEESEEHVGFIHHMCQEADMTTGNT
jgi:hypothetical protein